MSRERSPSKPGKSVFERHPVLTLAAVILLGLAGVMVAAEFVLASIRDEAPYSAELQYVRLRMGARNADLTITPTADEIGDGSEDLIRSYRYRSDSEGFIEPVELDERENLLIVFLGGSTTESFLVDEDKRWPYLAGKNLEAEVGEKVVSLNLGVSANHSMHSNLNLIAKVIPLHPDIVVLMHNINDFSTLYNEGTYWNDNPSRSLVVNSGDNDLGQTVLKAARNIKNATFPQLYRVVRDAFGIPPGAGIGAGGDVEPEWTSGAPIDFAFIESNFRASLRTFVGIARAWNIVPVLMTQGNRFPPSLAEAEGRYTRKFVTDIERRGLPYADFLRMYVRLNEVVREVARDEGVLLIDLDRLVPKNVSNFYDVIHLTTAGSEVQAQITSGALLGLVRQTIAEKPASD